MDTTRYLLGHLPNGVPYLSITTKSTIPVYLTPLYDTDVKGMAAVMSHPDVNSRLQNVPFPYTEATAEHWIKIQTSPDETQNPLRELQTAIRAGSPEKTGLFIGSVGLRTVNAQSKDFLMGYCLSPEYHGKGIMSVAVEGLLWWFSTAQEGADGEVKEPLLRSVSIQAAANNPGSRRVIEKVSFNGGFVLAPEREVVETWPESKGGGSSVVSCWTWSVDRGVA